MTKIDFRLRQQCNNRTACSTVQPEFCRYTSGRLPMHHQRMWASSLAVIPQTLSLPPANRVKFNKKFYICSDVTHTHTLLHTEAFTHRLLYTQTLFNTEAFTHRNFYTQKLLHTEAFAHRLLYTQKLLHTEAVTHRNFYTQILLHANTFTHRSFYTQTLSHTETGPVKSQSYFSF